MPALSNGHNYDPSFLSNCLINSQTTLRDMELIGTLLDPKDIPLVCALPLGLQNSLDVMGWHFTKSRKSTVKSGYYTAQMMKQSENQTRYFGPDIQSLHAYSWKIQCPPKLRYFIWQVLTGCVPVNSNLKKKGINCETSYGRCGTPEETINHTIFECPPALQNWALSQIPTVPGTFPSISLYVNMDHSFWRTPTDSHSSSFLWIMWYIWKARNDKIHENIDRDPRDTLKLVDNETNAWILAQLEVVNDLPPREIAGPEVINTTGYRSFIDGSWKESDNFSGLGWFYTLQCEDEPTMGATNLRRSLTCLHSEVEAPVWYS